ncbi:uncharacterized protein LOC119189510 [Manduca sexta]|uniref:uncharacterized protein LOC119189510 n=1 Tax=Manduca sexta TaxID=7130 RepID=UPI00188F19A5|nr:uncharacterized protein LOC119189510 [Manduca sexta]
MTEREEKELIKKRASFKGRLTAFANYLNDLNQSLSQSQVNELQIRISKIEKLYDQYDEVQLRLECLVDDVNLQTLERNDFETLYYKHLSYAQDILSRNIKNEVSGSEVSSHLSSRKQVELPTINLPSFNGAFESWIEFRDTFASLIHTNDDMDDINKFHYLRASVSGSASTVIRSVEFSDSTQFISRRGKPKHIYSDNGTSFVGAYNDIGKFLKSNCHSLPANMANEEINFHFIPPYSPHFGGLWEAGVKSIKYHFPKVLGNCNLTYEELNTVLVQIEAVLNSRPLTAISSDPNDLQPLSSGHFLIGRPLTAIPASNFKNSCTSYLNRFQRIEQLRQHFWTRWSKEYISELQERVKWRLNHSSLKVDSLVILKEEHLPPLKWKLGRVVAVYPGSDGITKVADIKTLSGVVRRSCSKICPLPDVDTSG